ncbi:hypothetical protein D3C72_1504710 [compost metagenome]
MDGRADAHIGAAAAHIARHGRVDVGVTGLLLALEQGSGAHDLAALAIAALRHVVFHPGRVHGLAHLVAGRHSLDGCDLLARRSRNRRDARTNRRAVQVHRASPAQSLAAAKLGAGHAQRVAQGPEDGGGFIGIHSRIFAIDVEGGHRGVLRGERCCCVTGGG